MVAALWFTIDVSIMANKQHAQSRPCPIESHCIRPSSPFSIVYGHHSAAVPDDECCQGPQWSINCSRSVFVTASLLPQPLVHCLHVGSRVSMWQDKECIRWHQLELRNLASWLTLQGWHTKKQHNCDCLRMWAILFLFLNISSSFQNTFIVAAYKVIYICKINVCPHSSDQRLWLFSPAHTTHAPCLS